MTEWKVSLYMLFTHWIAPVVLFVFALFFATYQLTESPAIWYDEGFFIQAAQNLADRGVQVMQLAPGDDLSSWSISAGYPFLIPIALSFKLFGFGLLEARAVMALFLILFLVGAYTVVRRLYTPMLAVGALALLATLPLLYGTGKAVLGEVPALFYCSLLLLALLALERGRYKNNWHYIYVGLAAGLTFAAKYIFMLVLPALIIGLYIKRREISQGQGIHGVLSLITAFIVPVLVWVYFQFGAHDSLTSILSYLSNPYENTASNAESIVLHNILRFITELTPLYMGAVFGTWALSLLLRVSREEISLSEYTAFAFSFLVLGAYVWSPGWYKYFFPALCISLMFFPHALQQCYQQLTRMLPYLANKTWIPLVFIGALSSMQFYQLGFHSYVADYYRSTRAAELTAYGTTLNTREHIFLYNVPEFAVFLPSKNYQQYVSPHPSQQFGAVYLQSIAARIPDVIVVNTETYTNDPTPFTGYVVSDRVSHYSFLRRQ